jgi:Mlc titration factor MtfA (ptsG expression regulator)
MQLGMIGLGLSAWASHRHGSAMDAEQIDAGLRAWLPRWDRFDGTEQRRLHAVATDVLARVRFEATRGFDVTDEMRILVAAQVAQLGMGLRDPVCPRVRTVVLHPTTDVLRGVRRSLIPGVVEEGAQPVLGHTTAGGPVFLAWDAAQRDALHPELGRNVVVHEFAHQLDVEDGWFDGMPPLLSDDARRRWVAVCEAEFRAGREGSGSRLIRGYAATNPAEFFAVVTELFFTRAADLAVDRPALHQLLVSYFGQDPSS